MLRTAARSRILSPCRGSWGSRCPRALRSGGIELAAGQASLKSTGAVTPGTLVNRRLQAKIGELLMETNCSTRRWTIVGGGLALWPGGGRGDEGRPLDLHASGVRRAGVSTRVAPRPLQRVCAAAGDRKPLAGNADIGNGPPPRTTWFGHIGRMIEADRRFMAKGTGKTWAKLRVELNPHVPGAGAPVGGSIDLQAQAAAWATRTARRRTTGPSPPRPPR